MKKTRLLEIIREEIAGALGETLYSGPESLKEPKVQQALSKMQGQEKADAVKGISTGTNPLNLEEEQLDEMAKITEPIRKGIEVAVDRMRKSKPDITPEEITKLIRNKKTQEKVAPELKTALDADEAEKGADPKYTYGLGYPQTLGAVQIAMGLKKAKGSEPKPEKPASTGQKGRPAGTAKEKVATRTPGADGFDDVSYTDVEDIDTEKAPAGDIEMEKAARGKDELVKQYKSEVEPELKNKIAKAKEGDKEAMAWLKSKQDIIKKYNQAKQVKV